MKKPVHSEILARLGDDRRKSFRKVLPELASIPDPGSFDQMVLRERELGARINQSDRTRACPSTFFICSD